MGSVSTGVVTASLLVFALGSTAAQALMIGSPDFFQGGAITAQYAFDRNGCTGGNTSPALHWSGAPSGTRSFAITAFDPDARNGRGFWHWVILDIPPSVDGLAANAGDPRAHLAPDGSVQIRNDHGTMGYGGPCPPPGPAHHYEFTVYALNVPALSVRPNASSAAAASLLPAHTLAKATLTGLYGR